MNNKIDSTLRSLNDLSTKLELVLLNFYATDYDLDPITEQVDSLNEKLKRLEHLQGDDVDLREVIQLGKKICLDCDVLFDDLDMGVSGVQNMMKSRIAANKQQSHITTKTPFTMISEKFSQLESSVSSI
jgi:hypothetical protein